MSNEQLCRRHVDDHGQLGIGGPETSFFWVKHICTRQTMPAISTYLPCNHSPWRVGVSVLYSYTHMHIYVACPAAACHMYLVGGPKSQSNSHRQRFFLTQYSFVASIELEPPAALPGALSSALSFSVPLVVMSAPRIMLLGDGEG